MGNGIATTARISCERKMKMEKYGIHHFYIGVIMIVVAFFGVTFEWMNIWLAAALLVAGLIIIVDDFYQHWRQRRYNDPYYRSPLNRLYVATLWRVPPIRWANTILDRILFLR